MQPLRPVSPSAVGVLRPQNRVLQTPRASSPASSRPQSRTGGNASLAPSTCNPNFFLSQYPGLRFEEKRPVTVESLQRLTRLAAPKANRGEQEAAPDAELTFSPQLGKLWHVEDWEGLVCRHKAATDEEVESWLPHSRRGTEIGKMRSRRGTEIDHQRSEKVDFVQSTKSLFSCNHARPTDRICKVCRFRLCSACFQKTCKHQQQAFFQQTDEEKIQTMQDDLRLSEWQARALLRSTIPVVQRLWSPSTSRGMARGKAGVDEEEKEEANMGAASSARKIRAEVFQRLTTPREAKPFAGIPYLPDMSKTLPDAKELGVAGLQDETLEKAVCKLKVERKINELQASVLLRCAAPVFERLYPKRMAESAKRYAKSEGETVPRRLSVGSSA